MRKINFVDYEDMSYGISDMLDEVTKNDIYNDISIIAKYEEAKKIICELIRIGYDINSLIINNADYDGYNIEYVISLTKFNDECEIWCEPMYRKNGYINIDANVVYILDNCFSKVISYCGGDFVYEVSIVSDQDEMCKEFDRWHCEYYDCDSHDHNNNDSNNRNDVYNSESLYISKDDNGVPVGFQKTWCDEKHGVNSYYNFSYYTSDLESLKKTAKELGIEMD